MWDSIIINVQRFFFNEDPIIKSLSGLNMNNIQWLEEDDTHDDYLLNYVNTCKIVTETISRSNTYFLISQSILRIL